MILVAGYRSWPNTACPSCGTNHMMIEDDGREGMYKATCWCGGHGYVRKDDPSIVAGLARTAHDG